MKRYLLLLVFFMLLVSSCNNGPFGSNGEEVLESEVLDKGLDEDVTEIPTTDFDGNKLGTEFSYKTWMLVKGQVRGDFEERVEAELTNVFRNTDVVLDVENLGVDDYNTSVSYKVRGKRQEGFVTIVDSILVYTVSCGNYSFDYELDYEVASYDDGVTRAVMPYYRIGTVTDKGITSYQDMDFVIEGDVNEVYLRTLMTHAISVEFKGKTYDLTAKVELRKYAGQHPCLVKSSCKGASVYFTGNEVVSTLEMDRTWSDGTSKKEDVVCRMQVYWDHVLLGSAEVTSYQDDIEIVSSGLMEGVEDMNYAADFVTIKRYKYEYHVDYNYPVSITMNLMKDRAWYDDGIFKREFFNLGVDSITFTNSEPVVKFLNTGTNEKGDYSVYLLMQTVTGEIDDLIFEGENTIELVSYE